MIRLTSLGHAAVLVETATQRILVDPWLTQRLDRFWEHHPEVPDDLSRALDGGVDHIVFSHHHFDHHHFPSLAKILDDSDVDFDESPRRAPETNCVFPVGPALPRFTASGLGHQAMPWTLRRLGFERLTPVTPGDTVQLGDVLVRTFVSNVPFPEMSLLLQTSDGNVMLCGDSILHESTVQFFDRPDAPRVDVAFVPAHSVSPPGVLTERRPLIDPQGVKARARANFDHYVTTLNARLTIPSSFGWKVSGEGAEDYDWCNRTIFPFTPFEALQRLRELDRRGALWGPGQVLEIQEGTTVLHHAPSAPDGYDFESLFAEVTMDPDFVVPAFDPERDCWGRQTRDNERLIGELMELLVGTDFWYRALDSGASHTLSLHGDDGVTSAYLLEPVSGRVVHIGTGAARKHTAEDSGYTEIAAGTLQSLLDGELLFGSSYVLWASNSNLLSAVFHHPVYYTRYVEQVLGAAAGSERKIDA
ncbi:MBL fold metallo-hydrolase [Streptomyces sp. NPDC020607]|uniref:MBL fold metallo-hydrolase n=1 Tax=Streptomyces sp. NPDC020607 TaxID=3365082 RepID=UPI0037B20327